MISTSRPGANSVESGEDLDLTPLRCRPACKRARRVLAVQSFSSADRAFASRQAGSRSRLLLGVAVAILLVFLTVIGASAQHGTGAAHLRRGPASVVLSVLFTLAGLAGVGSLALLFWGLVTRNRRTLDGSEPRRHSPIFVAGAALMVFACLAALLALAARGRHLRSLPALSGRPLSHTAAATNTLPFNKLASFTTSGIVIGIVVLLVMMRLARSIGWRRALHRLRPLASDTDRHGEPRRPATEGPR